MGADGGGDAGIALIARGRDGERAAAEFGVFSVEEGDRGVAGTFGSGSAEGQPGELADIALAPRIFARERRGALAEEVVRARLCGSGGIGLGLGMSLGIHGWRGSSCVSGSTACLSVAAAYGNAYRDDLYMGSRGRIVSTCRVVTTGCWLLPPYPSRQGGWRLGLRPVGGAEAFDVRRGLQVLPWPIACLL